MLTPPDRDPLGAAGACIAAATHAEAPRTVRILYAGHARLLLAEARERLERQERHLEAIEAELARTAGGAP